MDSICRAYSVDTSINSSVTMPSPLAVSIKRKMVFEANNRKANSKCEVVDDDDNDNDDDDYVHQASTSKEKAVDKNLVVDLSTGDDGCFLSSSCYSSCETYGNKTAAIWQHFKLYPSAYPSITDPSAHVKEWHKYAICRHCYD